MVKSFGMALVYCLGIIYTWESWQYHSFVDLQLCVKPDSTSIPDIST